MALQMVRPSKTPVGDSFLDYSRDMWNEYEQNYRGIGDSLAGVGGEDEILRDQRIAKNNVEGAYESSAGMLRRQRAGLGVRLDSDEAASEKRRLRLAKATSMADGQNRARESGVMRRREARSALMERDAGLERASLGLFGTAAGMESDRLADYETRLAEYKARQKRGFMGFLGSAIGIGASVFTGGLSSGLGR